MSKRILVATRNKGKLAELLRIFQDEIPGIELLTL
ncbi:MAG: non-canonical purine NTP pyrophosphatase, partial [Actinobacteria bacterium]|nr:non-canonical purine NTP pyrophosphatase [Actinomycetota bacterium]